MSVFKVNLLKIREDVQIIYANQHFLNYPKIINTYKNTMHPVNLIKLIFKIK